DADDFFFEDVDVPDDQGPGGEIVLSLPSQGCLRARPIIVFAANLGREYRRPVKELTAGAGADIESSIVRKRSAIGQLNDKSSVITIGSAVSSTSGAFSEARCNLKSCAAGQVAGWARKNQFSIDDFGLAVFWNAVEVLDCRFCPGTHDTVSLVLFRIDAQASDRPNRQNVRRRGSRRRPV